MICTNYFRRGLLLLCVAGVIASAGGQTFTQIRNSGSRATRLNVVFFAEGYTAAEAAKFQDDAALHLQVMLNDESWRRFADYINGFTIFVASNESGADDPNAGVMRDTYFSSSFNTSGIDRLLTIASGTNGTAKVLNLLTQYIPDYDLIIILVNSTKYGGSGGFFLTTSLNPSSREILLHELGHSFAKLTDEYVDTAAAPNYPPAEYPNATQKTARETIPWRDFIPDDTALPTASAFDADESHVGLFLGAHFRDAGFYRPTDNSKMRSLGRPFGPVNLRAYAAQFHSLNLDGAAASPVITAAPVGAIISAGSSYTLQVSATGAGPITYQWRRNGIYLSAGIQSALALDAVTATSGGVYSVEVTNAHGTTTTPDVVLAPAGQLGSSGAAIAAVNSGVPPGQSVSLTASFSPAPTNYLWRHDFTTVPTTGPTLAIPSMQASDGGLYFASSSSGAMTSPPAILGVTAAAKIVGAAREVASDIVHANHNIYDQILLEGAAAAIRTDLPKIVRMSFVDLTDDIVQVEFSGPGTLNLTLDAATGPAPAAKYNQPAVSYMRGHPSIVITGATEATHLAVFSVGRATAVDSSLFRSDVAYNGMADVAFIAISSNDGKFGEVRTGNVNYFASGGFTGLYAPGIAFQGPVYLGNISAADTATPVIVIGSSPDVRITGGDLQQSNNHSVQTRGLTRLQLTAGTDSHGNLQPAQPLRARLEEDGVDVTARVVP